MLFIWRWSEKSVEDEIVGVFGVGLFTLSFSNHGQQRTPNMSREYIYLEIFELDLVRHFVLGTLDPLVLIN